MTHDALLREADDLHGESWFRSPDEQPDYLDEAENALRYHLALRVMVSRLAAALRATQPSERVASMQADLDEMERLRADNAEAIQLLLRHLLDHAAELSREEGTWALIDTVVWLTKRGECPDESAYDAAVAKQTAAWDSERADLARLRAVETAAEEARDILADYTDGFEPGGAPFVEAYSILDAALTARRAADHIGDATNMVSDADQ